MERGEHHEAAEWFEATLELMEACYATPLRRHFEEVGAAPTGAAKALLGLFAAADAIRGFARMLRGDLEAAVSVQETPRKPGVFRLWRPVSRSIWVRFGSFLDR